MERLSLVTCSLPALNLGLTVVQVAKNWTWAEMRTCVTTKNKVGAVSGQPRGQTSSRVFKGELLPKNFGLRERSGLVEYCIIIGSNAASL
jgi:hypothetical protein